METWRRHFFRPLVLPSLFVAAASPFNPFDADAGGSRLRPRPRPRIVGGSPLPPPDLRARYPYMASLGWGVHRCGATLMAPDLLLTAAHCAFVRWEEEAGVRREWFTEEELSDGFVPSIYTAQLGKVTLNSHGDFGSNYLNANEIEGNGTSSWSETLVIEKTVAHPRFNVSDREGPPRSDVAIVKLYGSAKLTTFTKLNSNAALPPRFCEQFDVFTNTTFVAGDTKLTTMGYGTDVLDPAGDASQMADILHSTTVQYVPNHVCRSKGGGGLWDLIGDDVMCGHGGGERDSCSGDSGGPLFWEAAGSEIYQVGIVSWGVGCAHPTYPGAYMRISYYYEWIRDWTCALSKFPPASFACPPGMSGHVASVSFSIMALVVRFQLPPDAHRYGLLVELLGTDGNGDIESEETSLYVPPGSYKGMVGIQEYTMRVKLGGKYRLVLLNTHGVTEYGGRVTVQWGEEMLVDVRANQGPLQVYSIERHFFIPEDESGDSIARQTNSPSDVLSNSPSILELDVIEKSPHPTTALNPPSPPITTQTQNTDPGDFLAIEGGTHTIDAEFIVTNFGYNNGTVPMGISITGGFVYITSGVCIVPESGSNAITLNHGSYFFGDGCWLIGGSSQATTWQPRLWTRTVQVEEATVVGHGMMVIDSRVDVTKDFMSQGGRTDDAALTGGAGLYVSEGSTVTVRGGRFYGGLNSVDSTMDGPSLVVDGVDSIVHIHEGAFYGKWKVSSSGAIVVYVCSFTIDGDRVHATLVDGNHLEVPYINDGTGNITATTALAGCEESLASKGDAPAKEHVVVNYFSGAPSGLPRRSSTIQPSQPTSSPTIATSHLRLERPSVPEDEILTQHATPGVVTGITAGPSRPTSLSLQMDVEDLVFPSGIVPATENESSEMNSSDRKGRIDAFTGYLAATILLSMCY